MRVIFLDFDGVVNTPMWENRNGKLRCGYGFPKDGKVNNWQAVQWVSEFCQEFGYSIVVSSTWRKDGWETCERCLKNGGLREGIDVVGVTPVSKTGYRGEEIKAWLCAHPDVDGFLIFDDDEDMEPFPDRLVKCRGDVGFMMDEHTRAKMLHDAFNS